MSASTTDLQAQFEDQYARSEPSLDDYTKEAGPKVSCITNSC